MSVFDKYFRFGEYVSLVAPSTNSTIGLPDTALSAKFIEITGDSTAAIVYVAGKRLGADYYVRNSLSVSIDWTDAPGGSTVTIPSGATFAVMCGEDGWSSVSLSGTNIDLTALTQLSAEPAFNDRFLVYDTSAGSNKSVYWSWLKQSIGTLNGDVDGAAGSNTVRKIQGRDVAAGEPSAGSVLTWDGSEWAGDVVQLDIDALSSGTVAGAAKLVQDSGSGNQSVTWTNMLNWLGGAGDIDSDLIVSAGDFRVRYLSGDGTNVQLSATNFETSGNKIISSLGDLKIYPTGTSLDMQCKSATVGGLVFRHRATGTGNLALKIGSNATNNQQYVQIGGTDLGTGDIITNLGATQECLGVTYQVANATYPSRYQNGSVNPVRGVHITLGEWTLTKNCMKFERAFVVRDLTAGSTYDIKLLEPSVLTASNERLQYARVKIIHRAVAGDLLDLQTIEYIAGSFGTPAIAYVVSSNQVIKSGSTPPSVAVIAANEDSIRVTIASSSSQYWIYCIVEAWCFVEEI